jgi:hypothetical protein
VRDRGRRKLMVNRRGKKEGMEKKKNPFVQQKIQKKKIKKVISMVLTGIDPAPLCRQI